MRPAGNPRNRTERLAKVFERSQESRRRTLPIRKTSRGTWVPTPFPVIEGAIQTLKQLGYLGEGAPSGHVIDAGADDGRIPAVLVSLDPTRVVYGIEADPALHTQAVTNLEMLAAEGLIDRSGVHLIEGDCCDLAAYESRRIALDQTHIIFNYPDGNERRLAGFVSDRCGPGTQLCLLTHDRVLKVDELTLRDRHDVDAGNEPAWQLSLYMRKR